MMTKKTKWLRVLVLALALPALAGCAFAPTLETRTFAVNSLTPSEVAELVDPYVYGDREGAPGAVSVIDGALTVRETPDNLARIERVLQEFDRPRGDLRLRFQLIEADGFTDSDPRIADVEDQLRGLFHFRGYRLAGEATLTVADGAEVSQRMQASDGFYSVTGRIYRVGGDQARLENMELLGEDAYHLSTSVNIRPGQTVVLGSAARAGSSATLLLTARAESAQAGGADDGGAA